MKKLKRLKDFDGVDYSCAEKETAEEVLKKYERYMEEKRFLKCCSPWRLPGERSYIVSTAVCRFI